jgi:hypothetical protein
MSFSLIRYPCDEIRIEQLQLIPQATNCMHDNVKEIDSEVGCLLLSIYDLNVLI